ncbi:MAG TPA: 50S ribosomal protein L11 [Candidatus Paceibacterota bacterium]|nr:50S ribosomal protein L11 [Candidatus Paceibacterota bacterium]
MIINLLIEGGAMTPGPALAQKIGPLGIDIGKVISDVNKATESFKGTKVPVELDVNTSTKKYTIKVSTPPIAELLKKEAGLEKGSGEHKNVKVGNLAIEQIIFVAKLKLPNMLERNLKAAVKSTVGTCVSLGLLIENKLAKDVAIEVEEGVYDKLIAEEKTEVSQEKKNQLNKFFADLKDKQDKQQKKKEEEKVAEEAAKAAAKPAAVKAAAATPTAAAKTTPAAKTPVKGTKK